MGRERDQHSMAERMSKAMAIAKFEAFETSKNAARAAKPKDQENSEFILNPQKMTNTATATEQSSCLPT